MQKVMFACDSLGVGYLCSRGGERDAVLGGIAALTGSWPVTVGNTIALGLGECRLMGGSGLRTDEVQALGAHEFAQYVPDVLILGLGTNDCTQRNSGTTTLTEVQSIAAIRAILDAFRAVRPTGMAYVSLIIPNLTAGADTQITSLNAAISAAFAGWADRAHVRLVDENAAFRAYASWNTKLYADNTHANDLGQALRAATLLAVMAAG